MNRHFKKRAHLKWGASSIPPRQRWQSLLVSWVMAGLLAVFSLNSAYAAHNSEYVSAIGGTCPSAGVYVDDQWNFYRCECTSYVAWKLNNDGINFHNQYKGVHFSDAKTWKAAAENVSIPVDDTPRAGDVAWWDKGTWGHVAYVESVNADGSVNISEYNNSLDHSYTTRNISTADAYIHVNPVTQCKNEWYDDSAGELVRDYKDYGIIFNGSQVNYCLIDTRYNFIAILIRALETIY